jgi:hypothetical protein
MGEFIVFSCSKKDDKALEGVNKQEKYKIWVFKFYFPKYIHTGKNQRERINRFINIMEI